MQNSVSPINDNTIYSPPFMGGARGWVCFLSVFLLWTLIGALSKLAFLAVYASIIDGICASDWWDVIWHGLVLDVAIAGYLTIIPAIIIIISLWTRHKAIELVWKGYFAITGFISSLYFLTCIRRKYCALRLLGISTRQYPVALYKDITF